MAVLYQLGGRNQDVCPHVSFLTQLAVLLVQVQGEKGARRQRKWWIGSSLRHYHWIHMPLLPSSERWQIWICYFLRVQSQVSSRSTQVPCTNLRFLQKCRKAHLCHNGKDKLVHRCLCHCRTGTRVSCAGLKRVWVGEALWDSRSYARSRPCLLYSWVA